MNKDLLINASLCLLRIGVAVLMLTHGIPKLEMLLEGNASSFPDPIGLGSVFSLVLVVGAEVFCSIFLLIGLFTRLVSLPLIINMFVVVFVVHQGTDLQGKELPLIYLLVYLFFLLAGSGDWSADKAIRNLIDHSNMKAKGAWQMLFS